MQVEGLSRWRDHNNVSESTTCNIKKMVGEREDDRRRDGAVHVLLSIHKPTKDMEEILNTPSWRRRGYN